LRESVFGELGVVTLKVHCERLYLLEARFLHEGDEILVLDCCLFDDGAVLRTNIRDGECV
jgi:hypothetical protein